ncbi:hypothetical protein Q9Q99_09440 [Curtobacterium flaccumfaciens]|nr:hypothetical protein Q9Q99_09440 [Curtobacterium flaccumfaciens]
MSTPTSKEEPTRGIAGTASPPVTAAAGATATDAAASRAFSVEGITQSVSTVRVGRGYLWGLSFAQFGLFVALLTPVFVSMSIKATELNPTSPETVVGSVLPFGALGALFCQPAVRCALRPHPARGGVVVARGWSAVSWSSSAPSPGSRSRPTCCSSPWPGCSRRSPPTRCSRP